MSDVSKTNEELRKALNVAREHFSAIAASGEIKVWEDTGEKRGIDYQAKVWAERGARLASEALAATRVPVQGEPNDDREALAKVMDELAYYHCRSVNPKADHPRMGYHAMAEDQREHLREKQRDAAEEIVRMLPSLSRAAVPDAAKCKSCDREAAFCGHCTAEGVADAVTESATAQMSRLNIAMRKAKAERDAANEYAFFARQTLAEVEEERDAALAAVGRCREVAIQHRSVEQHNEMVPVTDIADLIREPSSADYLAALDGAPEPEEKP